jgi:glycosyltransferase involved in cell wall biosynthesis
MFYPNKANRLETFIYSHIERLKPDHEYYGGWYPRFNKEGKTFLIFPLNINLIRGTIKKVFPYVYHKLYSKAVAQEIRNNKIAVILAEYGPLGCSIMDACQETNTSLIVHFHGFDASEYATFKKYGKSYQKLFSISKHIIVVSNAMKEELKKFGAPEEKLFYNPYGVDINLFDGTDVSVNPPIFVSVGRFIPKKAPNLTILAFNEVHKKINKAKLIMVGNGPMFKSCKELVNELNLNEFVIFKGVLFPDEIKIILSKARAYVQHSVRANDGDMEGTPNAILEASAMALPVVSTEHSGIVEAVVHGKTGYLVKEHEYLKMAEYMTTLANNPALSLELGTNGRKHIIENYSLDFRIKRLNELVQSSIDN